jgi:hypothetical protein
MLSLKDRIMIKRNKKKSLKILDEVYKKVAEKRGDITMLDQVENIKEKYTSIKKVWGKWCVLIKIKNQTFSIPCFCKISALFMQKQLSFALTVLINKETL